METKEIEFEFERATKNTYRFQEKSSGFPVTGFLVALQFLYQSKLGTTHY